MNIKSIIPSAAVIMCVQLFDFQIDSWLNVSRLLAGAALLNHRYPIYLFARIYLSLLVLSDKINHGTRNWYLLIYWANEQQGCGMLKPTGII